jgi:hypothetical protein
MAANPGHSERDLRSETDTERREDPMNDEEVIKRIGGLVEEEHALERSLISGTGATDDTDARLRELEVALDQCWDLLRQRRARRATGDNPDQAAVREADVVEHYQQ